MTCDRNITPRNPLRPSPFSLGALLLAALAALFLLSLNSGYMPFTPGEIMALMLDKISGGEPRMPDNRVMVLWEVRLPRLLTALVSGAALGLSGAIFQGLLLNPLADPYTLGVSSGAACGAALVIILNLLLPGAAFLATPWAVSCGAFLMALLTLCVVILLARDEEKRLSPTNLILAGVIVSAILSAAISFIKYLAGDQVSSIIFWLLGSFQARVWSDAWVVLSFLLPALCLALWSAVDLNIMSQGLRSAETLGVNTRRVRLQLLAAASLAASSAVSVAGVIGFVGLIVPHLIRLITGPDHRSLLPLSALAGALLLLLADTAVRVWLPGEIPVGVLTALLAGPVFLVIFRRRAALEDISLKFWPGRHYILAGPNGAGKSTLLDLLAGLKKPAQGSIMVRGKPTSEYEAPELARLLALAPQEFHINFAFTVRELAAMGRRPYLGRWGRLSPADHEAVDRAIEALGLADLAHKPVTNISGGERRRALAARTLAQETPIILLDEPTAGLDIAHALALMALAEKKAREEGLLVVTVTHDLNLAAAFGHEFVFLKKGRLVAAGPTGEIFTDAVLGEVYEAEARVRPDEFSGGLSAAFRI